jgi:hypothetical protein
MKVTSALLTTMSGKLGGAVASKARGGIQYFRALVIPSNPRSALQTFMRQTLAGISAAWVATLTNAQRLGWEALADDEESGIDVYVKVNSQIIRAGGARVDAPPVSATLTAAPLTGVSYDASTDLLSYTNTTSDGDLYVNVYIQKTPQRPSQLAQNGHTSFAASDQLDAPATNTLSLAAFPGVAGAAAGDVLYVTFVQVNTNGQVAIPQTERVTVVA